VPGGEDRRAAIDRRLDETFGAFDAAVRAAQEQTARERAAQQGEAGAAGGGEETGAQGDGGSGPEAGTGGSRGGLESVGAGGEQNQGEGDRGSGSQGGGTGTGGATGSGPRDIPPDIPDGSDDDVVARQIREAAMKETDPELRAALWEEYRKYKKGQ
jgi:hypothetical protein